MKLVKTLFEPHDINVLEAGDAEQGITAVETHVPDLILMDIQLPGMDGLTTTKLIKEKPILAETPVIALTSHAMPSEKEKALSSGCYGYITKPINTRTFFSRLVEMTNWQTSDLSHLKIRSE